MKYIQTRQTPEALDCNEVLVAIMNFLILSSSNKAENTLTSKTETYTLYTPFIDIKNGIKVSYFNTSTVEIYYLK